MHPPVGRVPTRRNPSRDAGCRIPPTEQHPVQESHQREVGEHQPRDAPGVLTFLLARDAGTRAARRAAGAPLQLAGQQGHPSRGVPI